MAGGAPSPHLTLTLKSPLCSHHGHAVQIGKLAGRVLSQSNGEKNPVHGGHHLLPRQLFPAETIGHALHAVSIARPFSTPPAARGCRATDRRHPSRRLAGIPLDSTALHCAVVLTRAPKPCVAELHLT